MSLSHEKREPDSEALRNSPSQIGEVQSLVLTAHDAVFGDITEHGPNYRSVGLFGTAALMMKTQFGMGVLSIPTTFNTLGMIPGIVCLCSVGIITTWSNYVIGAFKLRHPEIYGIDDAGRMMFGVIGREVLGVAFCLYYIFVSGSGMLSISIGLNAVSSHGACTAVFIAAAAVVGFVLSSIRTLGRMTWLAWAGVTSIIVSILTLTVAVCIQSRPATTSHEGPWVIDWRLTKSPQFNEAVSAISSQVFAYAGTPGFFSIAAEMRDPSQYTKALIICQTVVTTFYIGIGVVVYYFCGSYVASPALGSAGVLMKKVCYGLALPSLFITVLLLTHLPAKYIFVRILRGSKHLTGNTFTHWATWLGCTFGISLTAYLVASGIPNFDSLVSLIGALLGTLMSFQPMGCMWLYDNWGASRRTAIWAFMVTWSMFVIASGSFIMVSGSYGSIISIMDSYQQSGGSGGWSCSDNSI